MIIRNLSRRSRSFEPLLRYMVQGQSQPQFITHNLNPSSRSLKTIAQEFYQNARFCKARKNGIFLYHEILSFDPEDSLVLTETALRELTLRYLKLRAPQAKAVAVVHTDTDCTHVHMMISANEVGRSKKLHVSQQRYFSIRRELEAFQKERFPELKHSLVFEHGERTQKVNGQSEVSLPKQSISQSLKGTSNVLVSRKEEIQAVIIDCLEKAETEAELRSKLQKSGLQLYRRGKTYGVRDLLDITRGKPKVYRLKKLGVIERFRERICQWHRVERDIVSYRPR